MEPTLVCPACRGTAFVDITNDFTSLKGKANQGIMEMEVTGQCAACGAQAYNSVVGPIDSFTLVTKSAVRR